jgi:hypothetical protein
MMTEPQRSEARSGLRARVWWGLAVAAIILGFVDLSGGGITLSAILLVLAYCVLIPIAILK